ncbi:hypothetical protein SAMN05216243_2245 [Sediminibacillus albus]|uniref:Uncharacterized protein n=1 Tax=Sediminibacillus albus TaxID=407036 RepID=A0A1G8ZXZ3_9BACI|nr:hypothetical protein SAMN05216243_2245 [Sediminibacillus albus]
MWLNIKRQPSLLFLMAVAYRGSMCKKLENTYFQLYDITITNTYYQKKQELTMAKIFPVKEWLDI